MGPIHCAGPNTTNNSLSPWLLSHTRPRVGPNTAKNTVAGPRTPQSLGPAAEGLAVAQLSDNAVATEQMQTQILGAVRTSQTITQDLINILFKFIFISKQFFCIVRINLTRLHM